jgi:hypothetical protein
MRVLTAILTALLLASTQSACSQACEELAKKRCQCEPNETDQLACSRRVDDEASSITVSEQQQEACEKLLDTCTCDSLRSGDLAACGLATETDR